MTAVIPSYDARIVEDEIELQTAGNLQDLLARTGRYFRRHHLDHAVLFRLSDDQNALVLPFVATLPSVVEPLHAAIVQKVHPAYLGCRQGIAVRTFADLQAGSQDALVRSLRQAFQAVRLDHVYELPLPTVTGEQFVLEIGRVGRAIGRDELSELHSTAGLIPDKLPWFMRRFEAERAEPCPEYVVS